MVLWSDKDEAIDEKSNSQEIQIDVNPTQWSFGILYHFWAEDVRNDNWLTVQTSPCCQNVAIPVMARQLNGSGH